MMPEPDYPFWLTHVVEEDKPYLTIDQSNSSNAEKNIAVHRRSDSLTPIESHIAAPFGMTLHIIIPLSLLLRFPILLLLFLSRTFLAVCVCLTVLLLWDLNSPSLYFLS